MREKKADLKRDYDDICRIAPEFGEAQELREFYWARTTASSRVFGLTMHGHKTDAFVPLAGN